MWLASHLDSVEAVMVRMGDAWTEPDCPVGRAPSPVISSIPAEFRTCSNGRRAATAAAGHVALCAERVSAGRNE
jgi:hypothetical protein